MAAIDVVLNDEMGLRVPSVPNVPITEGSEVTFTAGDGAASALYFSPATASILSPKPGARVDLAPGKAVAYAFASAGAGVYGVITQAPEVPPPGSFDFGAPSNPPVLVIQPGQGGDFGGPIIVPGGGGGG